MVRIEAPVTALEFDKQMNVFVAFFTRLGG